MSRIFEALRQSELEAQQRQPQPPMDMPPLPLPAPVQVPALAPLTEAMPALEPAPAIPSLAQNEAGAETETIAVAVARVVSAPVVVEVAAVAKPQPPAPAAPVFDLNQLISFTPEAAPQLVSLADERGLGAEKFRVLATRLSNIRRTTNLKIVQVTSSIVAEGKTLVSSNLAVTLAKRSGQSVLLIEGDLRKPAVCPMFGVPLPGVGLGDWWRQQEGSSIVPWLRRVGDSTLCILPAGAVQHPVALLQSGRMTDLVRELAGCFDWVVVDSPPILPMADANLWARLADGTLLVIREGVVSRRALRSAVDSMDSPKLIGLVLNDAVDFDQVEYYGRYYSYEGDTPPAGKTKAKGRK